MALGRVVSDKPNDKTRKSVWLTCFQCFRLVSAICLLRSDFVHVSALHRFQCLCYGKR